MSKILEIFSERHKKGQMYRNVPIKPDNSGNVHPLNYVYPDTKDSVTEDIVLGDDSVSLTRDVNRIRRFEETHAGARFLEKQILLQRSNPFEYTRNYREDNLKDHVDPTERKPRHGYKISIATGATAVSIPGEFTFVTGDVGKVQGETADKLVSSSGPVHLRLSSKEGMMNTGGLSVLDLASARVRRGLAERINDLLDPITRQIGQYRARVFGTAASMRPEVEYGYLEQIFQANRALKRSSDGGRYGHHYLSLSSEDYIDGTYREIFGTSAGRARVIDLHGHENIAPGFQNLQDRRDDSSDFVNLSIDRHFQSIINKIGGTIRRGVKKFVQGALKPLDRPINDLLSFASSFGVNFNQFRNPSSRIANYVTNFLPRSQDILLIRHLKRFVVDIDNVVENINNKGRALQKVQWDRSLIWIRYRESRVEEELEKGLEQGAHALTTTRGKYQSYFDAIQTYKGEDKTISIGFDRDGNNTTEGSRFVATKWDRPYYKDHMQENNPTIYRLDGSANPRFDSDSIDVIMRVLGREEDEEVRFRAFIQDIVETVTPTYNENKYIGRYESFYTYDRVVRDLGFSLTLHAFSLGERDVVMQKMAYLTSLAYPESSGGSGQGYLTPLATELTIGKLYTKQPCIVQNLTHTIENDTSWDIDQQIPMTISVNMAVRLLEKKLYTHAGMRDDQFTLYLKDVKNLEHLQSDGHAENIKSWFGKSGKDFLSLSNVRSVTDKIGRFFG